ncbi:TetR/AcrR family transcriptional regulator [Corynebacterium variabile]|uniref:TetR/AcrR family transcriptional regulator n=1 Tax=Corynebacterium variabile TaxID=1727 RepID=UPI0028AC9472|nr:TetR/AcrR family transcriptional regulator [Corynebacterium variabile]
MRSDKSLPSTADPRSEHSRRVLKDALRDLATGGAPERVSVSALCKAAGVSRPTFYQHFETVDDVYGALLRDRLDEFGAELRESLADGMPTRELIAAVVRRMDMDQNYYLSVLGLRQALPKARLVVSEWMEDWVARYRYGSPLVDLSPVDRYLTVFLVGGVLAVFGERIDEPDSLTPEELADILRTLVEEVGGDSSRSR